MNQPIDHPRAKSFSFKEVLGVDQKPYLVLEVGTDLRGHDLTETEAGRSLARPSHGTVQDWVWSLIALEEWKAVMRDRFRLGGSGRLGAVPL